MRDLSTRRRIGVLLALVLTLTGIATAAWGSQWMPSAQSGSDVKVSGCVIRFSDPDALPTIHANGAHMCAGVRSVGIDRAGRLEIVQTVTDPAKNPVLFAQCQADETLGGARGIICGATGGTAVTSFALYDTRLGRQLDLNKRSDRMRLQGRNSNLWVGWFHGSWAG